MKVNRVIVREEFPMQVRNEFVFEDLKPHIIKAIENSKFVRDSTHSFIKGFVVLSSANSFRRDNVEWHDQRTFCVGLINDTTHEVKLIHLFDLMPELADLY
jgi:hypothetical protein